MQNLQNEDIVSLSAGWNHSVALNKYGQLFVWGNNQFGQCGIVNDSDNETFKNKNIWKPTILHALSQIKILSITCGLRHTIAISQIGETFAWGENRHGQCGVQNLKRIYKPMKIDELSNICSTKASSGTRHSIILTKEGNAISFGCNRFGQCGFKSSNVIISPTIISLDESIIEEVRCGWNHSILISVNRKEVFSFGRNDYGQLGIGNFEPVQSPLLIPFFKNVEVEDVEIGSEHNIATTKDGDIYSWGWAEHGQLGHGDKINLCVPTKIEFFKKDDYTNRVGCGYGCSFLYQYLGEVSNK